MTIKEFLLSHYYWWKASRDHTKACEHANKLFAALESDYTNKVLVLELREAHKVTWDRFNRVSYYVTPAMWMTIPYAALLAGGVMFVMRLSLR
jgi:hypothetical protein